MGKADYRPRSKLFLSCDLTGSTAFKQRSRSDEQTTPWQKVFLQFYREFPQTIFSQVKFLGFDLHFELWKAVGDELIYTCEVRSEVEVCQAVEVWVAALEMYKRDSLQNEGSSGLGVKGGVFLATFPGPDHESTIPKTPDIEVSGRDVVVLNREALVREERSVEDYIFDYFGPSIDTGFRVLSRCDSRYLTLSLEVALVLSLMNNSHFGEGDQFKYPNLLLKERMELKGVWGGREYPVFALDLEAEDPVNTAIRKFLPEAADAASIAELCRACYGSDGWPFKIYLPDTVLRQFYEVPVDPLQSYLDSAPDPEIGGEERADDVVNPEGFGEQELSSLPTLPMN